MSHSHPEDTVMSSRQKPYPPAFKRQVQKLVHEKFGGDLFAYVFNLTQTVDTLEENLSNVNDAFLKRTA